MKRVRLISLLVCIGTAQLLCTGSYAAEKETRREKFENRTVLYKGEKKVGASLMYGSLNSGNSEVLLLMKNIDAAGRVLRIAPDFEMAYRDNASAGLRLSYIHALANVNALDLNLTSDLNFSLKDISVNVNGYSAAVFHRNYIGLSKSGSVGFYLEESLSFTGINTVMQGGGTDNTYKINLTLSPGFILYILPPVSIELGIGIADLGFIKAGSYSGGDQNGSRWQAKAAMNLNVLSLNFGIHYHF